MNRTQLLFSFIGKKYGYSWKKLRKFTNEFQYWDKDKVEAYQLSKLKQVIEHAYKNVPFYTRLFNEHGIKPDDIKTLSDLQKIPTICKSDVANNRQDFLASNWRDFKPLSRATGGTTGLAFKFYNDRQSWALGWAVKMRTFNWGGFEMGAETLAVMAGGSLLPQSKGTLKSRFWRWLLNYYSMPISHMTDDILEGYVNEIRKQKIKFIRGYPTAIYTLAKYLYSKNQKIQLKAVFTTAEMLYPHHRELFKLVFGCDTFDIYGAGDGMGQANECEVHKGLHLVPELSITNIIDKVGNEVKPDEEGELVFTSLVDFAMPMIRYKPGDLAIKRGRTCSCGRTAPLIEKIIGRSSDLIELSNGRKLNGLSIPFEAWTSQVEKFQIVQTDYDKVELNIIPKESFTEKEEKEALDVMKYHCGEGITVTVNLVNDIPVPKSGKFRYVVSKFDFKHQ